MRRNINRAVRVGRVCRIAVITGALSMAPGWSRQDAAWAQSDLDARVGKELDSLLVIYKQLHANPELSTQEEQTSAVIAKELRAAGFEVTDHFGEYASPETKAYGVVGVLRNGPGPTVMVRTDMDALPVVENTGVPYASKVRVKRADGSEVGVMHA
jgi:metal-dependent amidase/aminoacylase/carboxypeptidase family protein